MSFGAAFCDELNVALSELGHVLENAQATGLSADPTVVSGQVIYDDRSRLSVYVGFLGDACAKDTAEVSTAAEKVRTLIQQRTGVYIPPLRPDYHPAVGADLSNFPLWGYAVAGVVGLVAFAYVTGQTASIIRLWKPRRLRGYRRKR